MQFTYQLSERDYVKALALMLRRRSPVMVSLPWMMCFVLLWVLGTFIKTPSLLTENFTPAKLPKLVVGLGLPAFLALSPLLLRWNAAKQYRKSPVLAEVRKMTVTDAGIEFSSRSTNGDVAWRVYAAYAEDKNSFLLVQQGKQTFVPIPKRVMSAEEVASFREILTERLPKM